MRAASHLVTLFVVTVAMLPSIVVATQSAPGLYISGTITSSDTKLPGVVITAESTANGKSISTVSDDQGHYRLAVPTPGTYRVRAELFGFSPEERVLSVADYEAQTDFKLTLTAAEDIAANHDLQARQSADANELVPYHAVKSVVSTVWTNVSITNSVITVANKPKRIRITTITL